MSTRAVTDFPGPSSLGGPVVKQMKLTIENDTSEEGKKESYKKTSSSSDMSGELYEVYMSMLLFLRSEFHPGSFKLATNLDGAGAFDDIVLQLMDRETLKEKFYFLQLKHKATKPVTLEDLYAVSGNFSLIKYFCSYLEVKRNFPSDRSEFIIYTNTWLKNSDCGSSKANSFISSEGKIFTFTDKSIEYNTAYENLEVYRDSIKEISRREINQKLIRKSLQQFKDFALCKTLLKLIDDEHKFKEEAKTQYLELSRDSWNKFMENLKLYTEQPDLEKLEHIIKDTMEKFCGTSKIYQDFKENMIAWWRIKNESYYLTENIAPFWKSIVKNHVLYLMSTMKSKMELISKLRYQDSQYVPCTERITQVICQGPSDLPCLRVQQSLTDIEHLLIDITVLRQHVREVIFVWKYYKTLVVDASRSEDTGGSIDDQIIAEVSYFLHSNPEKRIIVISNSSNDHIVKELSKSFGVESYKDEFELSHMTNDSQKTVLECKVEFQGHSMELKYLVSDPSIITADLTLDLLRKEAIEIGPILPPERDNYIPRTLSRHEIVLKNIFKLLENHCICFSGISLSELRKFLPHNTVIAEFSGEGEIKENCRYFIINEKISFSELSERYKCIHWFEKRGNFFVWKESLGDITHVINNVDRYSNPTSYNNILEVLNVSPHVVLLTGEPGMGKSMEMIHLARVLKQENPATWVILVDLNEHTNILEMDNPTALELLCKAGKIKTEYEKYLFQHEFHSRGNIVILFDGFDEISPDYADKVINIVTEISKANIKLCLTSRSNMKENLEEKLCCLAFCLNPLTENEQINFMVKYWDQNSCDEGIQFAKRVLKLVPNSLNYKDVEFSSNPLHCFMLAEIFKCQAIQNNTSDVSSLHKNLDILQMYELFIDLKYKIHIRKDKSDSTNLHVKAKNKKMRKNLKQEYEILALVAFLNDEEFNSLANSKKLMKRYKQLLEPLKEETERNGVITGIVNNRPTFIHRTFMEFFVAHWLSENYEENRAFIVSKIFDIEWQTVKKFLDRILCVGYKLHIAVLNQDIPLVESLLVSGNIDVNERDEARRTALHLAVNYEQEDQQKILTILLNHGASVDIEDELYGLRPLQLAARINSWFAIESLLERGADKKDVNLIKNKIHDDMFLQETLKSLIIRGMKYVLDFMIECGVDVNLRLSHHFNVTLLHIAASTGQLSLVHLLVERGAYLEVRNENQETPVMCACEAGNFDVVKFLIDQGSQIHSVDDMGCTLLHKTIEHFFEDQDTSINASANERLEIVKYLIQRAVDNMACDNFGNTLLHSAAKYSNEDIIIELLNLGIDINVRNKKMETPAHKAASSFGRSNILKLLLDHHANPMVYDSYGNSLLHRAVEYCDEDIIIELLNFGIDVNVRNKRMETPICMASVYGRSNIVKLLLKHHADPMVCDSDGNSLLHLAVRYCDEDIIIQLLNLGIDVDVRNKKMETPAHIAASSYKRSNIVKLLLEHHADPMVYDSDGNTLLHLAVRYCDEDIIIQLLNLGIDVNVRNKKMETPAHIAASSYKRSNIVKLLLDRHADPMVYDSEGNSLLHYAVECCDESIVIQLLNLGIDINVTNKKMETPAHIAASSYGRSNIVKLLLRHHANPMVYDSGGNSLLHYAVKCCEEDIIIHLLNLGIDINVRNKKMETPAHIAAHCGSSNILKFLLEHHANPMVYDSEGNSLLHYAVECCDESIVIQLLNLGIDINVTNKKMETPAHIAASSYGRSNIVKLLLRHHANPMVYDSGGNSLLHCAVKWCEEDIIIHLLNLGIDINVRNKKMETPAHIAASSYGRSNIVKLLLEHYADPIVYDSDGNSLLHCAVRYGDEDIITQLLNLGVDVNVMNKKMETPARIAVSSYNSANIVKLLLDHGADPFYDSDDNSLLHYAVEWCEENIIIQLLNLGIDVNVRNKKMETPAHIAAHYGSSNILKLLLKHHADPLVYDSDGNSLLHCAIMCCDVDIIIQLLNLGIDVNVTNKKMESPAHIAASSGRPNIVKLLLDHDADPIACDSDSRI